MSEFFLPLSITVAFALLASLLVAVSIIPVLVSLFIRRRTAREESGYRRSRWVLYGLIGLVVLGVIVAIAGVRWPVCSTA